MPAPAHRRRRRTLVAGTAAGLVVLGGGAATAVALFQADSPTQAGCYSTLSPQADTTEAACGQVGWQVDG